jgi:hypothetical protein
MKATKKTIPALLGDSLQPSTWRLAIKTRYDSVEMLFTNKTMAEGEFKRIKAQAQFGGQWLTSIDLKEHKDDTRATETEPS